MKDLIGLIVAGIIRQEGESAESNNPGNLRKAPWLDKPVIEKNFWKPDTRAQGVAGIYHVVALHIAKGDTLSQVISSWAPQVDHNPTAIYIQNVRKWAGLPAVTPGQAELPLWTYLETPATGE